MKRNPMLARIEAAAEARYQKRLHASMDMLLQMGQYTGLTDRTGKRIFEGDIVRRETDYYGKHVCGLPGHCTGHSGLASGEICLAVSAQREAAGGLAEGTVLLEQID